MAKVNKQLRLGINREWTIAWAAECGKVPKGIDNSAYVGFNLCQKAKYGEKKVIVKTRVFDLAQSRFKNLAELAEAMELSTSQIYRVRDL